MKLRTNAMCGLVLLLPFALGCGKGVGNVFGKVTYKGVALISGNVLAVGEDGLPLRGEIQRDGTYVVRDVPLGLVRLGVLSYSPDELKNDPRPPEEPGTSTKTKVEEQQRKKKKNPLQFTPANPDENGWFPIPQRYYFPQDSGITCTLPRGDLNFDIKLE